MNVDSILVEIRNADLVRVGQVSVDDLVGATFVPTFNDAGSWTMTLPVLNADGSVNLECAALRQEGAGIIVTGPGGPLLSGNWLTAEWQADPRSAAGVWMFEGTTDLDILNGVLAYPDPTEVDPGAQATTNDVQTDPVGTLICYYVDANCGPSAPEERRNPRLTINSDPGRGPTRTKSPRFDTLLPLCRQIAAETNVRFDIVQDDTGLVLVTSSTSDLTGTVRWDVGNEQLSRVRGSHVAPRATHAVVAGRGEGTSRLIVETATPESLASAAIWGRRERFIDQRQTDEIAELQEVGELEVSLAGVVRTAFEVTPSEDLGASFGVEWDLGDTVTVVVDGSEYPARVTGAVLSFTESGLLVAAVLGDEELLVPGESLARQAADSAAYLGRNESPTGGTGGGGALVYVQPNEPLGVPVGTLWYDTDAYE